MDDNLIRLSYNKHTQRFGLIQNGKWIDDSLHCGEVLEIYNEKTNSWEKDRIEHNGSWYLYYSKLSGNELEGIIARPLYTDYFNY